MARKVLVLVGSKKGAFISESDEGRKSWSLRGPFRETWPMNHDIGDASSEAKYGEGGNEGFSPAVWNLGGRVRRALCEGRRGGELAAHCGDSTDDFVGRDADRRGLR